MIYRTIGNPRVGLTMTFGLISAFAAFVSQGSQGPAQTPSPSALLRGKILFEGNAPTPRRINMVADPYCGQFTNTSDDTRVSEGGLENVIVYVSSAINETFPTPADPVILDQKECRFQPHVLTLQVGQKLISRNSNATAQNVHAWSQVNSPFNVALARAGAEFTHVFDKPEMPFPIRCDVHNWEVAYVGVFNHPYHTVSKAGGEFELKLPPGEYQITAWHERLGSSQQLVQIAANDNPPLYFVFR